MAYLISNMGARRPIARTMGRQSLVAGSLHTDGLFCNRLSNGSFKITIFYGFVDEKLLDSSAFSGLYTKAVSKPTFRRRQLSTVGIFWTKQIELLHGRLLRRLVLAS